MKRTTIASLFALSCGLALASSCASSNSRTTGTETNWLVSCNTDSDCGAYACYCGVCSASCKEDADCEHEEVSGICAPSASVTACGEDSPKRVCIADESALASIDASVPAPGVDASNGETSGQGPTASDDAGMMSGQPTQPSPGGTTSPTGGPFLYAAIPCTDRAPTQCYQGDECYTVFASAVDGEERIVGCAGSGDSVDAYCARSPEGEALLLNSALPDGWTTAEPGDCEPECFSPWRNKDRVGELPGCPCTSRGSVCEDGVGMECFDATDDLGDDRSWQVTEAPCAETPDCSGGMRLNECMARFEVCIPSGIVLDTSIRTYCGEQEIPCEQRAEWGCQDDCEPFLGVNLAGQQTFAGCRSPGTASSCELSDEQQCIRQSTPQTSVEANFSQPIWLASCDTPAGFAILDPMLCDPESEIDCARRDEASCTEPCMPVMGRSEPNGSAEYVTCSSVPCSASRTVCARDADGNHFEFFGCAAPGWFEVDGAECNGTASARPESGGACLSETAADGSPLLRALDANNYALSLDFEIARTVIGPGSDLTLDWSGVTQDMLKHPIGAGDMTNITVALFEYDYDQIIDRLERDALGGEATVGVTCPLDGSLTSVNVLDMYMPYTGLQRATPEQIDPYFDPAQADPDIWSYLVVINQGDILKSHVKMMHHLRMDPNSTNHTVTLTNDSTVVNATADLTSKPALSIPANTSDITVDWLDMVDNALGEDFFDSSIGEVRVRHYPFTTTELEARTLDWDLLYDVEYSGAPDGVEQINLSTLVDTQGNAFAGIEGDVGGTWMVMLMCREDICGNPAPWFAAVLETCPTAE